MNEILLTASVILPIASPIPYIRSILRGETKPHRTTRLIYLSIGMLTTYSLIASGDRVAVWISLISLIQSAVLFVMGMRYGVGGWAKTDIVCLVLSVLGIAAWQAGNDPVWGLYFGILADFAGTVPTLLKTARAPRSEEPWFYILDSAAGLCNASAATPTHLPAIAYPLYLFSVNALIAVIILLPRLHRQAPEAVGQRNG